MPVLPRLRGVLRSLAGRGPVDRHLDAEVGGYFDMLVDEKIAAGMSEAEARRQARLEMGGVEQVKEAVRMVRPAAWLDNVARDVRYSVRLLAKTPVFSVTAVLLLALGIGANAAVFGFINTLLFRPLPGSERPGEAVAVYTRDAARPDAYEPFSYADYETVRDHGKVFDHVMAHTSFQVGLTDGVTSRRVKAALATGNYFATLGVSLAAGRTFSPEEDRLGSGAAVMVLSHSYWRSLGSPADILGKTIPVNSRPFTVIGLAPAGFAGRMAFAGPAFWMPLGAAPLFAPPSAQPPALGLMVVGRLKPGVTLAAANAAVGALSDSLVRSPDGSRQVLSAGPLSRGSQGNDPADAEMEPAMVVAFGALEGSALIVLVIASLNVANMQLARGSSRRKEIAMRLALGAGRGRIVAQLMTEGLLLALTGGVLGVVASAWTVQALLASLIPLVPETLSFDVSPDWRVALVSLTCCTLSALVFTLGPAWKLSRLNLLPEMKSQDGIGAGGGLRRFGTRNLLVAGQVALSLALLAASGLFVRGAVAARAAEPGYSFDRQVLVRLDATTAGLDETAGRRAYARLIEEVRSLPGVESAAMASNVAFANEFYNRRVWRPGASEGTKTRTKIGVLAISFDIGAGYFTTLNLRMLRGREFTLAEEQDPTSTGVAIIDEPLASKLFPGVDPLGQFVQFGPDRKGEPPVAVRIVGVARGVKHRLTDAGPVSHIYLPLGAHYRALLNLHVRTAQGVDGVRAIRAALGGMRPAEEGKPAILDVQSLREARDARPTTWLVGIGARTFGAFGAIALLMATVGLYGVKAYLVARRTREIGIRMAIGAGAGDVVRMVLKEGAALLVASIALGFLMAVGAGQVVSSLLVGVRPFDPLVLSVATLLLTGAILAACYLPARRATRVSPMIALRIE